MTLHIDPCWDDRERYGDTAKRDGPACGERERERGGCGVVNDDEELATSDEGNSTVSASVCVIEEIEKKKRTLVLNQNNLNGLKK